MIKVAIVDDHAIVRTGFKAKIANANDIIFVGEAASGEECIRLVAKEKPNVVFIDLHLPKMTGLETAKRLVRKDSTIKIVFLTGARDISTLRRIITRPYVDGIMTKNCMLSYATLIRMVHAGQRFIQPDLAYAMLMQNQASAIDQLTDREFEIALMYAQGNSRKQISLTLNISLKSASNVIRRCIHKLGIAGSQQLQALLLGKSKPSEILFS